MVKWQCSFSYIKIPQVFFKGNIKDVLLRSSGFLCLPCPLYRKAVGTRSYYNRTADSYELIFIVYRSA